MSSAIVNQQQQISAWSPSQLALIQQQIAKGCSEDEIKLFEQVCHQQGLNPFARQIYAIKRKEKQDDGTYAQKMTIQVSIDGFRLIAERTGKYDGSETFWCGEDGIWKDVWLSDKKPLAAKTVIYKSGCSRTFSGIALAKEMAGEYGMWKKMFAHMLGKISEAGALRKAFPAELSGLYTTDEIPLPSDMAIDAEIVTDQPNRKQLIAEMMRCADAAEVDKDGVKALSMQQFKKTSSNDLENNEIEWMTDEFRRMATEPQANGTSS